MARKTVYLDYSGNGIWVLVTSITIMPYPCLSACVSPAKLLEIAKTNGWRVVLSDLAQVLTDNDLKDLPAASQYHRFLEYQKIVPTA